MGRQMMLQTGGGGWKRTDESQCICRKLNNVPLRLDIIGAIGAKNLVLPSCFCFCIGIICLYFISIRRRTVLALPVAQGFHVLQEVEEQLVHMLAQCGVQLLRDCA